MKSDILLSFENKWVAVNPKNQKVVASATSIIELQKKLDTIKDKDSEIMFVPPFKTVYAPYAKVRI